jgi:two-component system sensor histidine kinase DctS
MLPPALTSSSSSPQRLWLWPRIALVLFLLAMASLLWYSHREEREEQRAVLISDVLWMEQDLRFHFNQVEEQLRPLLQLHPQQPDQLARLQQHAIFMQNNSAGIVAIQLWQGRQLRFGPQQGVPAELDAAFRLTQASRHAVFSAPFKYQRENHIAVLLQQANITAVAWISLPRLIEQQVPWWFAHRYQLVLQDWQGQVLASKSSVEAGAAQLSYQLALEPPGHGINLQVTAYQVQSSLTRNLLVAAVICLAIILLYSWWRLRLNLQQKLQAEAALQQEHAFRQAMEDSLAVGMRARDLEGRITYVNPAFCRMVGYSAAELIGSMPPHPYWDPADIATHEQLFQQVLAGNAPLHGQPTTVRHRDGHLVQTMVYTAPLIDASGVQRGWMSSVVDVSEQRRVEALTHKQEQVLQQTAKLVTMGEMASTLAHELNQPLMALSSYASAARELAQQPQQQALLHSTLDKIAEQAQRAARIVKRIREFVGRREMEPETTDISRMIHDAISLIAPEARQRKVKLSVELPAALPMLQADRILLQQVLLNLINNALDACAGMEKRQIRISAEVVENQLQLCVCDNGKGVAAADEARLFEAFYSTKPQGMGMGLAICRSIIENHHGQLWFEPNPDGGSCFRCCLPL